MRVLAHAPSKFALTELTLRSLVELERAKAGLDFEGEVLGELSNALLETSGPEDNTGPFRFVEPGYYEPYERLTRHFHTGEASQVDRIQSYIKEVSDQLSQIALGEAALAPNLLRVCVSLHQELIQEITAEDMLVVNEWPGAAEGAQAGVGAA